MKLSVAVSSSSSALGTALRCGRWGEVTDSLWAAGAAPMRRADTTVAGSGAFCCAAATGGSPVFDGGALFGRGGGAPPRIAATSGDGPAFAAAFCCTTRTLSEKGPIAISSTDRTSQAVTRCPLTNTPVSLCWS